MSPKTWREELGKSSIEMGRYVGVTRKSWYNYEAGLRAPPLDVVARCQKLSGGRVTVDSWLAVNMAIAKIPPGRTSGTRLQTRLADAARA